MNIEIDQEAIRREVADKALKALQGDIASVVSAAVVKALRGASGQPEGRSQ